MLTCDWLALTGVLATKVTINVIILIPNNFNSNLQQEFYGGSLVHLINGSHWYDKGFWEEPFILEEVTSVSTL